jgi:hypothetical protein
MGLFGNSDDSKQVWSLKGMEPMSGVEPLTC